MIVADDQRIVRLYSATSYDHTYYSVLSAFSGLSLDIPQGTIYTEAPDGSGGTKGLITLMFQNGPVATFDPGNLGISAANYGFIALDLVGGGTPCDVMAGCFYSGTNSACAVNLQDGSGNITGGRIYAVMNQTAVSGTPPSDSEELYGRLYALTITTSSISETWDYDFAGDAIVGPSAASPMCSPSGRIFTDYGAKLQDGNTCLSLTGMVTLPTGTSCGAGVVGLVDCASPFASCGTLPYGVIYKFPISSLPTDASGYGTGVTNAGQYFTANFSYDPTNSCFWVRPYGVETMSCLSTTSASVVEAINIANLATAGGTIHSEWNAIFPSSNVPIATSPTNTSDSLAIIGGRTRAGRYAVLGIDTGQCSSGPCCTGWVSYGALSCPSSGFTPNMSWYFNLTANYGGLAGGQFTVVNDTYGSPCLVVFTDNLEGAWFLSTPTETQGGCAE